MSLPASRTYRRSTSDRIIGTSWRNEPSHAATLWKELQARIFEDQPYTFLYWVSDLVAVHRRFRDAKIDMLSTLHNLNTWWVSREDVKYAD